MPFKSQIKTPEEILARIPLERRAPGSKAETAEEVADDAIRALRAQIEPVSAIPDPPGVIR